MAQIESLRTGQKFKKTEAGEIPVEWEVMSLGEASKEMYRYPTYYNIKYVEKGIPEVRGELIKPNGTLETDMSLYRFISQETATQFSRTRLQEGDFVISVRGTMGEVGIVPKELDGANMTANLIRISPDRNKIYPLWLQQVFISERFQEQLDKASSSTTIKTIKAPELESLKLGVPTIIEQKKIAEILLTVDSAIEKSSQLIDKKKELKKGLMQELLSCGIGHKKFYKTEIGEIPEGWEVVRLGKYIKILPGFPFDSEFFSDTEKGFPLIRIRDLERSYTETYYTGEYDSDFIVEKNDLLIGMDGDFYVVLWKGEPGLLNQRICKIDSINSQLDSGYLYHCLIGKIKKIQDSTPSTTVKHLSTKDIENIKLALPSLREQKRISEILSSMDTGIDNEIQEKSKLGLLKKGLMQVLLTGKVRV